MFKPALPAAFAPELLWRYVPVRGGELIRGWIAGPMVGIQSHFGKHTKPCRSWITDGKLKCSFGEKCVSRFVAYIGLYTHPEQERVVVMIPRSTALKMPVLLTGTPATFSRSKAKNNPPLKAFLDNPDALPESVTKTMRRRPAQDIRPYLLHLWQDEPVCIHCGSEFIPSLASERDRQRQVLDASSSHEMGS